MEGSEQPVEVPLEQSRLVEVENDIVSLKSEHMRLLERVSLLELTSNQYEDQFDQNSKNGVGLNDLFLRQS